MREIIGIGAFWLWAVSAQAHPHVFVDVGLQFHTDDAGRLTAIEVSWTYDEFYTLLLLEDHGFDPDADGHLTPDERDALIGFDLADWPDWFEGGVFLFNGEGRITPGDPEALDLVLHDGRLRTRHVRPIVPVSPVDLIIRAYDPSYYAALTLEMVEGLPGSCTQEVIRHDPDAAAAQIAGQFGDISEAAFDEARVGIYYADTLAVSCAGS